MKNRIGFWLLIMFVAFILGRIISPVLAAPITEQEFIQEPQKQLTGDLNNSLEVFLQQYWNNEAEKLLAEWMANEPKKPKGIEI